MLISGIYSQDLQQSDLVIRKVELVSPWVTQGAKLVHDNSRRPRSCFDLVRSEQVCDGAETLSYGNRVGKNWDIFAISGGGDSQTRMVDLGQHKWSDAFTIPEIEPWAALKPGETRHVMINTSGADGAPGRNADGSIASQSSSKKPVQTIDYANAPLTRQVTSTIRMGGKLEKSDNFTPLTEVKKEHMYLVRVVDSLNDHYILFRVDDVTRGEKVMLSYFSFKPFLVP